VAATYSLPYGKTHLTFVLPAGRTADVLLPRPAQPLADPAAAVRAALDEPQGGVCLEQFRGARSAAIAVNDKTRPVPHDILLPPLLARLEALGLPPQAITLFIATGLHPRMEPHEFVSILPAEVLCRHPVVCHDARDPSGLIEVGVTRRGTPVWVNRRYREADLRLAVGNIEPHQFQGFSGGVKSVAIGLAGEATIVRNHAWMLDPAARLGEYEANPARQDVEEIGHLVGVHFVLNAILNSKRQIVSVLAGEPQAVMRAGVPLARQLAEVEVAAPYDLVLASPGGHPKDINLYQSQKALAHAALLTRQGGTVILAAACPEGTGSPEYEAWARRCTSLAEVVERFLAEGFRIGPHKAYQIARDALRLNLLLVSEMAPAFVRSLLLTPAASLKAALAQVLPGLPPDARLAVLPQAGAVIPPGGVL
jgi:nickel-dependent lactate racemase